MHGDRRATWTADGDTAAYQDTATNSLALITSDRRLKKNIIPFTGSLDIIKQFNTYKYNDLDEKEGSKLKLGLLAQEVLPLFPELTYSFTKEDSPETYYGVHYDKLPVLLLDAIKELDSKVDRLSGLGIIDTTATPGKTGPGVLLHVKATTDTNVLRLEDSTGTCDHNPGSASEAVSCSSDRRLKTHIREAAPVLDYLRGLPIKDYTVMASKEEATGVVAQEILEKYPELVKQDEKGFYMVSAISSWKIVKAIQELADTIEAQKKEIEQLKEKIQP